MSLPTPIPFEAGTMSYQIAERMFRGESDDEIATALKLKTKQRIYSTRNRMRKRLKQPRTTGTSSTRSSTPERVEATNRDGETLQVPPRLPPETPQAPYTLPVVPGTEHTVTVKGFAPNKTIAFTPHNLLMYQWFTAKYGYEGDLSDFVNDAIEDFFRSRNWRLKIVKEETIA